jgi:hypothetical protein
MCDRPAGRRPEAAALCAAELSLRPHHVSRVPGVASGVLVPSVSDGPPLDVPARALPAVAPERLVPSVSVRPVPAADGGVPALRAPVPVDDVRPGLAVHDRVPGLRALLPAAHDRVPGLRAAVPVRAVHRGADAHVHLPAAHAAVRLPAVAHVPAADAPVRLPADAHVPAVRCAAPVRVAAVLPDGDVPADASPRLHDVADLTATLRADLATGPMPHRRPAVRRQRPRVRPDDHDAVPANAATTGRRPATVLPRWPIRNVQPVRRLTPFVARPRGHGRGASSFSRDVDPEPRCMISPGHFSPC